MAAIPPAPYRMRTKRAGPLVWAARTFLGSRSRGPPVPSGAASSVWASACMPFAVTARARPEASQPKVMAW